MRATARRFLSITVAVPALLFAVPSSAAPRPGCPFVTDPAGDVGLRMGLVGDPVPEPAPVPWPAPALDLLSADLSADASVIRVTLRVEDLGDLTGVPNGTGYVVRLSLSGELFMLIAVRSPSETWANLYGYTAPAETVPPDDSPNYSARIGAIDVVYDEGRDEVRLSTRPRQLSGYLARGTKIHDLSFESRRHATEGDAGLDADEVSTDRTYLAGSRGCASG